MVVEPALPAARAAAGGLDADGPAPYRAARRAARRPPATTARRRSRAARRRRRGHLRATRGRDRCRSGLALLSLVAVRSRSVTGIRPAGRLELATDARR